MAPARLRLAAVGSERHGRGGVDARQQPVHRQPLADQPGGADRDVDARGRAAAGDLLGGACVSCEPAGPVQALAPPELRTTARAAVGDGLLAPQHRARPAPVAGEDGGGRVARAVVDDEREVGAAARLEPGRDAGGAEARGAVTLTAPPRPAAGPSVSGRPRARFAHWSAAPAVPLVRLSMRRRRRPGRRRSSRATCRWPCWRRRVGGARPAALGQQVDERLVGVGLGPGPRTSAASTPGRGPARCTVARMPRGIGASVGVNETRDRLRRRPRRGTARSRGCAGGRRPRRTGVIEPMTSVPSRCGLSGPARAGRAGGGDDDDVVGSSRPAAKPGARASETAVG